MRAVTLMTIPLVWATPADVTVSIFSFCRNGTHLKLKRCENCTAHFIRGEITCSHQGMTLFFPLAPLRVPDMMTQKAKSTSSGIQGGEGEVRLKLIFQVVFEEKGV